MERAIISVMSGIRVIMAVFIALACVSRHSVRGDSPDFNVLVKLRVDGKYDLRQGDQCKGGKYSCELSALGVLKRDPDGDFILYDLEGETPENGLIHWIEAISEGENIQLEDAVRPELRMRFAIREQGRVRLDLLMTGNTDTPVLREHRRGLLLPRSRTGAGGDREVLYNRFVSRGSNRVDWRESDMDSPEGVTGKGKWEWRRVRGPWTHFHKVSFSFRVQTPLREAR